MSDAGYLIELPVLGIATRFETNDARVARCVDEAFGTWRTLSAETASSDASGEPPLIVRVDVVEGRRRRFPPTATLWSHSARRHWRAGSTSSSRPASIGSRRGGRRFATH